MVFNFGKSMSVSSTISQIRGRFAHYLNDSPEFEDSEELRKLLINAVVVRLILLTLLLGTSSWMIFSLGQGFSNLLGLFWFIATTFAISILNIWCLKKSDDMKILSVLQLITDVILSTVAVYLLGNHGSVFLYSLIIIGSSVIHGSIGAVATAACCGVFYAILASGIIPAVDGKEMSTNTPEILLVYIGLIVVALISSSVARYVDKTKRIAEIRADKITELTHHQDQVFQDLAEGIITVDVDETITSINMAARTIMGLSELESDSFIGKDLPKFLNNLGVDSVKNLLKEKSDPSPSELKIQSSNNEERCLSYLVRSLKNNQGDTTGKLFIFNDVSQIKSMEARLSLHEQMTKLMAEDIDDSIGTVVENIKMIGESQAMKNVFQLVGKVASSEASILISGESGTGKELISKAVHLSSERASGPFVAVNCGAIPENLIESELFGHKKGSFTGAISQNLGLFRQADGGTIFLDEIGELPLNLQSKLLRALQEKVVRPVGDVNDISINVRVIAATNRDLKEEVGLGQFREDLYYRLNVVNIDLPPLRNRKEDIPHLVKYFISKFSKEDEQMAQISPVSLQHLMAYGFPGNIRELENLIERAIVLGGNAILPEHLPSEVISDGEMLSQNRANSNGSKEDTDISFLPIDLEKELELLERNYLVEALSQAGGIKKNAAELLGLNFRSFRYRLKKYGLAEKGE